jgi:hypothetical protein
MEDRDTDEFILVLKGYYKLLMTMSLPVDRKGDTSHMDSGGNIVFFVYRKT